MSPTVITAINLSSGTTADEEAVKTIISGINISFQRWGLTCMSQMEQNGTGREAEVGDVGSELNPLQRRWGIKDNVIFIPCESCRTKGLKIVYHLTHKALIRVHCNNNYYSAL